MKKAFSYAIALALLAIAALPYFFGLRTEQVIRQRLAEASVKGQVGFEILNYERGYLKSNINLVISLDFLDDVASRDPESRKLTRLLVQGTIHHGPLTFLAGSFEGESAPPLALGAMDATLFFEQEPVFYQMFFGQSPLITSRILISLGGDLQLAVKGQRLAYKAQDGSLEIDWKGFMARLKFSGDKLDGQIDGPGLTAKSQMGSFILDGYASAFDLERHQTGYYLGKQKMSMDGVRVEVSDQNLFRSGKLILEYDSRAQGQLMSFNSAVDFDRFEVGKRVFGPMRLKTSGKNIDLSGVRKLEQSYKDMLVNLEASRTADEGREETDPALRPDARVGTQPLPKLTDEAVLALKTIIAGGPSLEIPLFNLDTPEGKIEGKFNMGIDSAAQIDFNRPDAVTTALFMDFDLKVPRVLAQEFLKLGKSQELKKNALRTGEEADKEALIMAGRELEGKIAQGFYLVEGTNLRLKGNLKSGVLNINGKRIPL